MLVPNRRKVNPGKLWHWGQTIFFLPAVILTVCSLYKTWTIVNSCIFDDASALTPRDEDDMEHLVKRLLEATSSERLSRIGKQYNEQYAANTPFPHIALDNVFPKSYLRKVLLEHPESDVEDAMVRFLEELTGIKNIVSDPHYWGSGLHFTDGDGGKLNIHADFNTLPGYQLDRRVNVFIYLNEDWSDEYGGHLELWSRDMKSCMKRISVDFGRLVVFSSTDFSYHGHPVPMTAPKGRVRRSLAMYYYSNGRPVEECLNGACGGSHSTLWQEPVGCERCEQLQCKRYVENESFPQLE
eukprot:CAMPEP_0172528188 /NCGR_PEP_ID=MMETSP1067-20121228/2658_1 /TAXON_ID=265564 ORGANISM="Thalassiosira punctigera, Strain Tpunct2005C2" /NCGR_SAMPLE_ID=MMETSP1067 /ASSEMBLY_ACC=CAM_ASM_000444 /LENGTH=296 /DNA_ID=CAMNT_0013312061 /DNA_START=476 /DNA_END=1367 /DNA_ORIENTATION=+